MANKMLLSCWILLSIFILILEKEKFIASFFNMLKLQIINHCSKYSHLLIANIISTKCWRDYIIVIRWVLCIGISNHKI